MSVEEIQQFDEKNLFVNNLQECKESITVNNITNNYSNDQTMIDSLLQQHKEMIAVLKDEIQFLRLQLELYSKDKNRNA